MMDRVKDVAPANISSPSTLSLLGNGGDKHHPAAASPEQASFWPSSGDVIPSTAFIGLPRFPSLDSMAPLVSRLQYPPVCWIGEDLSLNPEDHLLHLQRKDHQRFIIDHRRIKMHVPTEYHYRKYDGNCVVHVRAQVMMRDDSTGGWLPLGGGGMSNVSVRKARKLHQVVDEPCTHEYVIYGKRASDQQTEEEENPVILNCAIKKDFEYHRVMPTFHHWRFGDVKFGLTFQTAADARAFDRAVRVAIEDLLEGLSETSPLHQTTLDIGEDDVFMQLDLPMEKPIESRLRSSKSATPPSKTNNNGPSSSPELYERQGLTTQHHKLHQTRQRHAPITMSKSVSPPKATPRYLSATHSDASSVSATTLAPPPSSLPVPSVPPPSFQQAPPAPIRVPAANDHHEKSKLLSNVNFTDKDSSYVKFPRRMDPSHEYSYPKLIDAYGKAEKKLTPPPPPPPLEKVGGVSSSSSSASSKKSRQSLPSLVLSYGNRAERGGVSEVGVINFEDGESSHTSLSPLGMSSSLQADTSATSSMTLICAHCRKSFNPATNKKGACRYAPHDWVRTTVETVTCLSCARCLLYHCISDPDEDEEAHPCECTYNSSGVRRWLGLTLLSILVPCLCCYPPLMACYRGAAACRLCGGRHEASKTQLF